MSTDILDFAAKMHCQELHMQVDNATGLKGIIAIHDTTLGPALGGCRCVEYPSTTEAVLDAIRLARGMTYKSALAGLPLGGGKMVLMKPAHITDRVAYFKAAGRFVDSLQGRYVTAVDSGTSVEDMDIIATETKHVTSTSHGGLTVADPSVLTAHGVERGIEAAVKFKLKKDSLAGLHVTIQGVGHAGYNLAKNLHAKGVRLTIYDINKEAAKRCVTEFGATAVDSLDKLLSLECDVFAPSALGGVINDNTISKLKASIVAGCANNQLAESRHGMALLEKDILYAPDYVVNAGGVIYVAVNYSHITEAQAKQKIEHLYDTLMEIFTRSEKEKRATNEIADILARERLTGAKKA